VDMKQAYRFPEQRFRRKMPVTDTVFNQALPLCYEIVSMNKESP